MASLYKHTYENKSVWSQSHLSTFFKRSSVFFGSLMRTRLEVVLYHEKEPERDRHYTSYNNWASHSKLNRTGSPWLTFLQFKTLRWCVVIREYVIRDLSPSSLLFVLIQSRLMLMQNCSTSYEYVEVVPFIIHFLFNFKKTVNQGFLCYGYGYWSSKAGSSVYQNKSVLCGIAIHAYFNDNYSVKSVTYVLTV